MPNHVTTVLRAAPEVLAALIRGLTEQELEEERAYDEERRKRILERDGNEDVFKPSKRLEPGWQFVDFNLVIPVSEDDPRITATKHEYPGGMVGYSMDGVSHMDLCREAWGTKWNAYDALIDDRKNQISFDTAWTHPSPVIKALSEKFPEELLFIEYADEDIGNNCGSYCMAYGEVLYGGPFDDGSWEANELAAQVKYECSYEELRAEWDAEV